MEKQAPAPLEHPAGGDAYTPSGAGYTPSQRSQVSAAVAVGGGGGEGRAGVPSLGDADSCRCTSERVSRRVSRRVSKRVCKRVSLGVSLGVSLSVSVSVFL